jgi:hypothetical protein
MTVPIGPNFATYIGDGVTTVFAYDFRIPTLDNVEVSIIQLSDGAQTILTPADYTITGVSIDNYAGGTVTYPLSGSPLASTHRIYIRRIAPLTQPTDLRNQGGYYPETVEFTFDWLEFQIQMLSELLGRAALSPPGEEGITIVPGPSGWLPQYDLNGDLTLSLDPALFTSGTSPTFGVVSFGPWVANGVQTDWTLPIAPVLAGNLVVFISGVFQDFAARTVLGTTLTFTSPPPAGTTISGYVIAVSSAVQIPTPGSVGALELDAADVGPMRAVLDVYSKAEVDTKDKGVAGVPIPSAATIDLGASAGDFVDITGTTTINSLGTASAGVERTVRFTGILQLTYNATSLQLYSRRNIITYSGLVMRFRSLGSGNWIEATQTPARGTWTPTLTFGGAATGMTFAVGNGGTFVKHGKIITVQGSLRLATKGSSVGSAVIGGLPEPAPNNSGGAATFGLVQNMSGLTGAIQGSTAGASTTNLNPRQANATGNAVLNDTNFTDTSRIEFTLTYEVA